MILMSICCADKAKDLSDNNKSIDVADNRNIIEEYIIRDNIILRNNTNKVIPIEILIKMLEEITEESIIKYALKTLDILSNTGLNIECDINDNILYINVSIKEYFSVYSFEHPFMCDDKLVEKVKACPTYQKLMNNIFASYLIPKYIPNLINEYYMQYGERLFINIHKDNQYRKFCELINIPYILKDINVYDLSRNFTQQDFYNINNKFAIENPFNIVLQMVGFRDTGLQSRKAHAQLVHMINKYLEISGMSGQVINFQIYYSTDALTPFAYIKIIMNSEQKLSVSKINVYGVNENINRMLKNKLQNYPLIYKSIIDDILMPYDQNCHHIIYENNLSNNTRIVNIYLAFNANKFPITEINFQNFPISNTILFKIAAKHDILLKHSCNQNNIQILAEKFKKLFGKEPEVQQIDNNGIVLNIMHSGNPPMWQAIWDDYSNLLSWSSSGFAVNFGTLNFHTIYNKLHSIVIKPGIQLALSEISFYPGLDYYTLLDHNMLLEANIATSFRIISMIKLLRNKDALTDKKILDKWSIFSPKIQFKLNKNIKNHQFSIDIDINIQKNINDFINSYHSYFDQKDQLKEVDNTLLFPMLKFMYQYEIIKTLLNLTNRFDLNIYSKYGSNIQNELFFYSSKINSKINNILCGSIILFGKLWSNTDTCYGMDDSTIIKCIGYKDEKYYFTNYSVGFRLYSLNEIENTYKYIGMNIASVVFGTFIQGYISDNYIVKGDNKKWNIGALGSVGFVIGIQIQGKLIYIAICMTLDGWRVNIGIMSNIHVMAKYNMQKNMEIFTESHL